MSQPKQLSKSSKAQPTQPKPTVSKRTYTCFYCRGETRNPNEVCTQCSNFTESDDFQRLASSRVPLKNLVYIIGIPESIANEETLGSYEYLGQYGKIRKIVVSKNKKDKVNSAFSAYVTFQTEREAAIAIYALDEFPIQNRTIRAFFGTTKYCAYFLKDSKCLNEDCVYLHEFLKDETLISTEEHEKKKVTISYLSNFYEDFKKVKPRAVSTVFPSFAGIIKSIEKSHEGKSSSERKNSRKNGENGQKAANKPLDIISMDYNSSKNTQNDGNEDKAHEKQEKDSNSQKKQSFNQKISEKEYHSDEHSFSSEETSESFNKQRRNTVEVSDIDQLIIKSFISVKFGMNKNSRFGFAKQGEGKSDGFLESQREKIAKSIKDFFMRWNEKRGQIEETAIFDFSEVEVHKDD